MLNLVNEYESNDEILNQLSENFKVVVKKWAQYMMKKTKKTHERHYKKLNKFQLIVNINHLDIDDANNVLKGRVNVVLNIKNNTDQSYQFFKTFHGNLEDLFRLSFTKKWIEPNSRWYQLLGIY